MTLDVDYYLTRRFCRRSYNCWHFVKDVWMDLCGSPLVDTNTDNYVQIESPVSPCLVLMQGRDPTPHAGVYYKGKILHMQQIGPRYQAQHLATLGFQTVSFYRPR